MIPHNRAQMTDKDGRITRDWYDFFRRLAPFVSNDPNTTPSTQVTLPSPSSGYYGYVNLPKTTTGLEVGKCFSTTSGVTIPTRAEGDLCAVYNNSGSAITLTQDSGLTLRVAGTGTTGNYPLPQRGLVTIWWHSATEAIIL